MIWSKIYTRTTKKNSTWLKSLCYYTYLCANFRVLSFLGHFACFFFKNPYPIPEVISFGLCTQVVPSWLRYTKEKKKRFSSYLKCKTASQWWIKVVIWSPEVTSQTLTVESELPEIMTRSSYCKHKTDPVWPVRMRWQANDWRSHILMVLSLKPDTEKENRKY